MHSRRVLREIFMIPVITDILFGSTLLIISIFSVNNLLKFKLDMREHSVFAEGGPQRCEKG